MSGQIKIDADGLDSILAMTSRIYKGWSETRSAGGVRDGINEVLRDLDWKVRKKEDIDNALNNVKKRLNRQYDRVANLVLLTKGAAEEADNLNDSLEHRIGSMGVASIAMTASVISGASSILGDFFSVSSTSIVQSRIDDILAQADSVNEFLAFDPNASEYIEKLREYGLTDDEIWEHCKGYLKDGKFEKASVENGLLPELRGLTENPPVINLAGLMVACPSIAASVSTLRGDGMSDDEIFRLCGEYIEDRKVRDEEGLDVILKNSTRQGHMENMFSEYMNKPFKNEYMGSLGCDAFTKWAWNEMYGYQRSLKDRISDPQPKLDDSLDIMNRLHIGDAVLLSNGKSGDGCKTHTFIVDCWNDNGITVYEATGTNNGNVLRKHFYPWSGGNTLNSSIANYFGGDVDSDNAVFAIYHARNY